MTEIKILGTKEVKALNKIAEAQWGSIFPKEFSYVRSDKNKIYMISRDADKLDLKKLRIQSMGLYVAEEKNGQLRVSIEGSFIIGPNAKKNVIELSEDDMRSWLRGEDLPYEGKEEGFVLIKHNRDFFGSGKVFEGKILNFVPKARRLMVE